jgi:hypothetical protein
MGPRFAKYLDIALAENDPHDMTRTIVAIQARTIELLEKNAGGASTDQSKQALTEADGIANQWEALKAAQTKASLAKQTADRCAAAGDVAGAAKAQRELDAASSEATEIYKGLDGLFGAHKATCKSMVEGGKTWDEVLNTNDKLAGIIDKQEKRLARARDFYSWMEVMRMFRALIESVNRHMHRALCPKCGNDFPLTKGLTSVQTDWGTTMLAFYAETQEPLDMKRVEKDRDKWEAKHGSPRPPE